MANFGPLAAEIGSLVWGTPANFNRFCILVALRYSSSGHPPNFVALNRGRHRYSTGQPSRWASAHIVVQSVAASLSQIITCEPIYYFNITNVVKLPVIYVGGKSLASYR